MSRWTSILTSSDIYKNEKQDCLENALQISLPDTLEKQLFGDLKVPVIFDNLNSHHHNHASKNMSTAEHRLPPKLSTLTVK